MLIVDQLAENFKGAKFIFMTRNPYAVVEGLLRKSARSSWCRETDPSDLFKIAANHVINCLKYQRHNIEIWNERGVFFTYEQMCENPEKSKFQCAGLFRNSTI